MPLNFRDIMIARGLYPGTPAPELTPGCDPAGTVARLGSNVTGWASGDRVTVNFFLDDVGAGFTPEIQQSSIGSARQGSLSEYMVVPAHALVRVPEHMSFNEASALGCAGTRWDADRDRGGADDGGVGTTAWNALFGGTAPIKPGQTVVLQGTGGVSLFAAQIALATGVRVILTSSSDKKLETAKALGVKVRELSLYCVAEC